MNPSIPNISVVSASRVSGLRFAIIYEDFDCGVRAKRFADQLDSSFGCEPGSEHRLWRQDLLAGEEIATVAARDLAESDFVILSLRGEGALSPVVTRWLKKGLSENPCAASIVALFDPAASVRHFVQGTRAFLRGMAEDAGLDFFSHCALPTKAEAVPFTPYLERMPERNWRREAQLANVA